MNIRPYKDTERLYAYANSSQIKGQTGFIGHLRGDFGKDGNEFWTTWFDWDDDNKTQEFKDTLDKVINNLRKDSCLTNRQNCLKFIEANPDSKIKGSYCDEYIFRIDENNFTFILRLNPTLNDYNFYCFCYITKWFDNHINEATQNCIRFINSKYKTLFWIKDGDKITIQNSDNKDKTTKVCRYIDETHTEIGDNLYHICQFAEICEKNNKIYTPENPTMAFFPNTKN